MPDDEIPLKVDLLRYVDQRFKDLEQRMIAEDRALAATAAAAAKSLDHRLSSMNEFREQLSKERGSYVTAEVHRAEIQTISSTASASQKEVERRLGALEILMANYIGRFWALGVAVTLLTIAINIYLNYWTSHPPLK